ncbi:winged helix-turn-helix transcriptional regulator [Pararobbsia silviterrae]|uniref:winged helix-turn-helix transcriptional regulator n=1 Tax=Pararobbsia silviterrae TaxID=1792498 RepID=UPI00131424C8|nr:helix-turn-helix domain-containing protein [Pararobbsia silviterrae]
MSKAASNKGKPPLNRPLVAIEACGLAHAADLLGDRWVLLILREAFYGVTRFDAIREDIGASRQALSSRLEQLTQAGILIARAYQEPGARARNEYVLTAKGASLAPILLALLEWGQTHCLSAKARVRVVERASGRHVTCQFATADGRVVSGKDLELQLCA